MVWEDAFPTETRRFLGSTLNFRGVPIASNISSSIYLQILQLPVAPLRWENFDLPMVWTSCRSMRCDQIQIFGIQQEILTKNWPKIRRISGIPKLGTVRKARWEIHHRPGIWCPWISPKWRCRWWATSCPGWFSCGSNKWGPILVTWGVSYHGPV